MPQNYTICVLYHQRHLCRNYGLKILILGGCGNETLLGSLFAICRKLGKSAMQKLYVSRGVSKNLMWLLF